MPMATQFVTKNTDNPNKPIKIIKGFSITLDVEWNACQQNELHTY